MNKIELQIIALANSESHPGNFAIILEESEGNRRLPIIIGGSEAQAIAVALERIQPNRPLTHDLFKNMLIELGAEIEEVTISKLEEGVFHATITCKKEDGEILEIDSRTSDAIALAVRFGCQIYTVEPVMEAASIQVDNNVKEEAQKEEKELRPLEQQSLADLRSLLDKLLAKEDYESAARVRDMIKRKEDNNN